MNLLRVIPSMDPAIGGPCQGIRNSIANLEELGIHNEVLSLDAPDASFLGNDIFKIHALGPSQKPWAYSKELSTWLYQNICRFDAVIIHGLWQYHSYCVHKIVRTYRKQNKKTPKYFVMPHGMLDPWFQRAKSRKIKAIRNWIYWKVIEKNVINDADGILFTCEEEKLLARETFYPYHPKKEESIGYGIATPPSLTKEMANGFKKKYTNLESSPYLLFLSRIHPKKGIDLLIKAYLKLRREGVDLPKLVIAGPGIDTTFGKEMLKMASVDSNIIFPGMLINNDKWGAFYNCEAFILPSHQENFGIAIVEAMACKKPVLISNQVNIWREIIEGNGGLVSDDDEKGVYEILHNWMDLTNAERKKMGENAYSVYKSNFSIKEASWKMAQFLNENL